jgi:perosamine synthetase
VNIRTRVLAPAGSPMSAGVLWRWLRSAPQWPQAPAAFREAIAARFGVDHVFVASTGRAGLTLILRAMRAWIEPRRDEVIVPSYTCYSVPASIVRAGLRVRIVDINPSTLDYDWQELEATDFSRVAAIVATNLYGFPNQLGKLAALARDRGTYLIDDAAQAMGARAGDRLCGTYGDAGIFSLDKGKAISAIDGGVIVTNSDRLASALQQFMASSASAGVVGTVKYAAKIAAYSVFLRPTLFAIPSAIPALGLGTTRYTTNFPLESLSPMLAALGVAMLPELDGFLETRRRRALEWSTALSEFPALRPIIPVPDAAPSYLRLPVIASDTGVRRRIIDALGMLGMGVTSSYPQSIADIPDLQSAMAGRPSAAHGRFIAGRILTFPTHPYVTTHDIGRAVSCIASVLAEDATGLSSNVATL